MSPARIAWLLGEARYENELLEFFNGARHGAATKDSQVVCLMVQSSVGASMPAVSFHSRGVRSLYSALL